LREEWRGREKRGENEEEDVSSYWIILKGTGKILEIETESTRSHSEENSL